MLSALSAYTRIWMGVGARQVDHADLPGWIMLAGIVAAAPTCAAAGFAILLVAWAAAVHLPEILGFPLFMALAAAALLVQFTTWFLTYTLVTDALARLTRPPAP